MSNDMKCPFCQQELNQDNPQSIECRNDDCKKSYFMYGSKELWQELIRTRKALDKAKHALQELKDVIACPPDLSYETGVSMYADGELQEITALEKSELENLEMLVNNVFK